LPGKQLFSKLFYKLYSFICIHYHFVRKNFETGEIYLALVPIVSDIGGFIEAVNKTPLLESTKKSRRVMDTNLAGRQ
jgi:uncharacterized protein